MFRPKLCVFPYCVLSHICFVCFYAVDEALEEHPGYKISSDDDIAWLSVGSEIQMICIWFRHCH